MLKYITSILVLFVCFIGNAQQTPPSQQPLSKKGVEAKNIIIEETLNDSIQHKSAYGFRLGADISKPIISNFNDTYTGLELVADYRIKKNWYLATELGYEEKTVEEDFTTSTITGSYIKLGANLNLYKNWLDMNNEIYVGGRYGFSIFENTLDEYFPNVTDTEFSNYFPSTYKTGNISESGLTMHWLEFQLGTKVETFKNLFLGLSAAFKVALSIQNPEGFQTLYAPGFNNILDTKTGFGFNYTISYLIPFKKK